MVLLCAYDFWAAIFWLANLQYTTIILEIYQLLILSWVWQDTKTSNLLQSETFTDKSSKTAKKMQKHNHVTTVYNQKSPLNFNVCPIPIQSFQLRWWCHFFPHTYIVSQNFAFCLCPKKWKLKAVNKLFGLVSNISPCVVLLLCSHMARKNFD